MVINKIDEIIKSIRPSKCNENVIEVLTHAGETIQIFHGVQRYKGNNISDDVLLVQEESGGTNYYHLIIEPDTDL